VRLVDARLVDAELATTVKDAFPEEGVAAAPAGRDARAADPPTVTNVVTPWGHRWGHRAAHIARLAHTAPRG